MGDNVFVLLSGGGSLGHVSSSLININRKLVFKMSLCNFSGRRNKLFLLKLQVEFINTKTQPYLIRYTMGFSSYSLSWSGITSCFFFFLTLYLFIRHTRNEGNINVSSDIGEQEQTD